MSEQNEQKHLEEMMREIKAVHADIRCMHGELIAALRIMTSLASQIRDLRDDESQVRQVMGNLAQRLATLPGVDGAQAQVCPDCGGPLTHHKAAAGDLCICQSCGWSGFFGQGIAQTHAAAGTIPLVRDEPEAWTQDGSGG